MQTPSASTFSLRLHHPDDRPDTPSEPLSAATKAFIISGIDKRTGADRIVCESCFEQLDEAQRTNLRAAPWSEGCLLCEVKEDKPEAYTRPFCDFLTENPTVFHAVQYFKEKLSAAGFEEVGVLPFVLYVCHLARDSIDELQCEFSSPREINGSDRLGQAESTGLQGTEAPSSLLPSVAPTFRDPASP